jgi:hypothetical protein
MAALAGMDESERSLRERQGIEWAGRFTWSAHAAEAVQVYGEVLRGEKLLA